MMLNRLFIIIIGIALVGCGSDESFDEEITKIEYDYSNLEYKELSIFDNYTLQVPLQTIDSVYANKDGVYTTFLVLNNIIFNCQSVGVSNQLIPSMKEGLNDSIREEVIIIDDTILSSWLFALDWGYVISYHLIDSVGMTFPMDLSDLNDSVDTTSLIDLSNATDTTGYNLKPLVTHSSLIIDVKYNTPKEKEVILNILNSITKNEDAK